MQHGMLRQSFFFFCECPCTSIFLISLAVLYHLHLEHCYHWTLNLLINAEGPLVSLINDANGAEWVGTPRPAGTLLRNAEFSMFSIIKSWTRLAFFVPQETADALTLGWVVLWRTLGRISRVKRFLAHFFCFRSLKNVLLLVVWVPCHLGAV